MSAAKCGVVRPLTRTMMVLPCPGASVRRNFASARRALYSECLFMSPRQRAPERHTKVLFMPLAEDGETVNMVFVMQVFFYIDEKTRERHFIDTRPYQEIAHVLL